MPEDQALTDFLMRVSGTEENDVSESFKISPVSDDDMEIAEYILANVDEEE